MKTVFLDAGTLGDDLDLSSFNDFGITEIYDRTPPELIAERADGADFVIVNKVKLNAETLKCGKLPSLILVAATGYDNIDTDFMKSNGTGVCNVVGYSTDSVAQLTLAMALSLKTNLADFTSYVSSGKYSEGGSANCLTPTYHELAGMTWGVVGYGNIGKKVAAVAKAIGCRVVVNKKNYEEGIGFVSLEELCSTSDIISVHTPLNDSTRNLINSEMIALMKKDAVFINVARGAVADEEALVRAVENTSVGGLGIDVYTSEPFGKESPYYRIRDRKNVCLTPHMAWGSYEARVRCLDEIYMNIKSFLEGGKRSRIV